MGNKEDDRQHGDGKQSAGVESSGKPCRRVTVTHLDSPPSFGKRSIHPRRPAPIVPTREQRTGETPAKDED